MKFKTKPFIEFYFIWLNYLKFSITDYQINFKYSFCPPPWAVSRAVCFILTSFLVSQNVRAGNCVPRCDVCRYQQSGTLTSQSPRHTLVWCVLQACGNPLAPVVVVLPGTFHVHRSSTVLWSPWRKRVWIQVTAHHSESLFYCLRQGSSLFRFSRDSPPFMGFNPWKTRVNIKTFYILPPRLYRMPQWIGRFCNTVFLWFGNTGADASNAILLPTLKCFTCNGAVDWSTTCFCCESVLQKRWQFCDRWRRISKRDRDSSQSCCSISPCHQDLSSASQSCCSVSPCHQDLSSASQSCCSISPCHQDLSSKLRGYWFTLKKKGGSVKTVRTPENIAVVSEAIERSPHRSGGIWNLKSSKFQHPTQFRSWNIQFSKKSHEFLWTCFKE